MQNRYSGDVGDFVKFAVLRALSADDIRVGVMWWLYPDERHNSDGKHRAYLNQATRWRHLDVGLFDSLARVSRFETRNVIALEQMGSLRADYFSDPIPIELPPLDRSAARADWLTRGVSHLQFCDIFFLDPDNGIASARVKATQKRAGKSVLMEDLCRVGADGRSLIVYHHQSRFSGGHHTEFRALTERLTVAGFLVNGALRAKPWSPRLFILIGCENRVCERARNIADRWGEAMQWLPAD